MFMAQIEFYTMALLTMMLLPFMMSQHTSFLSNNAIAAMFNCAMKVCVIAFLSVVDMSALGRYFNDLMANALKPDNFAALYNSEAPSTPGNSSGGSGMDAKNTNAADKSSPGI